MMGVAKIALERALERLSHFGTCGFIEPLTVSDDHHEHEDVGAEEEQTSQGQEKAIRDIQSLFSRSDWFDLAVIDAVRR